MIFGIDNALSKSIDKAHHAILESMEIVINTNTNFLIINDIQAKIVIYSYDTNLKTLYTSKYVYIELLTELPYIMPSFLNKCLQYMVI